MPAFMRPRASFLCIIDPSRLLLKPHSIAYGEYNDRVREVAGIRGQTLVNWDFECVLPFLH